MTSSNATTEPCEMCETGTVHRSLIRHTFRYGDPRVQTPVEIVIENCPVWTCDACGEGFFRGDEYEDLETNAIQEFLGRAIS